MNRVELFFGANRLWIIYLGYRAGEVKTEEGPETPSAMACRA
jgi:hypothetical protein